MGYSLFHKALIILVYIALNKTINMLNKYIIGMYGFKFPLFLSGCHQLFCFVGLAPMMLLAKYRSKHKASISQQWLGLIFISTFFALSLSLNNYSLITIPLSLNQVIRCHHAPPVPCDHPVRNHVFSLFDRYGCHHACIAKRIQHCVAPNLYTPTSSLGTPRWRAARTSQRTRVLTACAAPPDREFSMLPVAGRRSRW
jgi:hypothetical protein